MSVHCRIIVGPTVEILNKMNHADFKKAHDFIDNKHPELDDTYDRLRSPGDKMILFMDGMNGRYLRLTYVQKCTESAKLSEGNEMVELNTPIDADVIKQMQDLYKEYTGEDLNPENIKYTMWTQWT